jgi:hypothetical protein
MATKPSLKRRALKQVRKTFGEHSALERESRSLRNVVRFWAGRPVERRDLYAIRQGRERFGIFGIGGCDVTTTVGAGSILSRAYEGTLCVGSFTKADHVRSDLLVQTLDPPDPDTTREVADKLGLIDTYFSPVLFEPTFRIPDQRGLGEFPKNVVVLSVSADTARTVYRHREHGFLVDPGGWWLTTDMATVLNDLSAAKWFGKTFAKVRRISVEDSMANFERIIAEVRERTGAFVVLMNVLTVDPGSSSLDYMHANSPHRVRRREFYLAAAELAAKTNVPLLDVDRLTKEMGISRQADFVHYTPEQKKRISEELARLLIREGVLGNGAGLSMPVEGLTG